MVAVWARADTPWPKLATIRIRITGRNLFAE
jgi:hypothetical protein